jgi:glutamate dehydrogenase/leucine dehydrogenase
MHTDTLQLVDEWEPEKVVCVSDRRSGMRGVLVIDSSARGVGKGEARMSPNLGVMEVARPARTMTCAMISTKMRQNPLAVVAEARTRNLTTHAAAHEFAQERVRAAMALRGQIPGRGEVHEHA